MISEAIHRGETVYNVALRIDPNSLMHAAAFQLIRNVLHGCGTVIALRPEDNSAAATVEIVEAALATTQPEERLTQRCRIPAIVSELRVERMSHIEPASTNSSATFLKLRPPTPRLTLKITVANAEGCQNPPRRVLPPPPSSKARYVWMPRASTPS